MKPLLRILVVLAILLPAASPPDTHRALADVEARLVPNDSNYADQWNMKLIGMEDAWDVTTGAPSVVVAVLDTGIYSSNPDFRDASGGSRILPGKNFRNTSTPNDTEDYNAGHGTFVAGIIGALGNNGYAIAGMAWTTKLLPVKVLDDSLNVSKETVRDGINYAVEQGARVVNLSLCATEDFPEVRGAVEAAISRGVLLVAPGGNIGTHLRSDQVCYPAAYPGVYAVSAVDNNQQRPSYSQQGAYIDIAAPGGTSSVPIRSSYRTSTRTDYGTSHSAPHVAGLAALMMSISPTISAETVKDIINGTATDLGTPGRDDQYGYGLINAAAAVRAVLSPSLRLSPTSLQILADPSGAHGLSPVLIEAAGHQVQFDITSGASWLLVDGGSAASGTTPATVTVSLDLGQLPKGATSTTALSVRSSSLDGTGSSSTLPVTVWHSTSPFEFAYLPAVFDDVDAGW